MPLGRDLPSVFVAVEDTESLGESLVGEELTEEKSVVTLHDDGGREDDTEDHTFPVGLESMHDRHLLLTGDGVGGIVNVLSVVLGNDSGTAGRFNVLVVVNVLDILLVLDGVVVGRVVESRHGEMSVAE